MKQIKLIRDLLSLKARTLFLELTNKKNRLINEQNYSDYQNNIYAFLDLNNFRSTFDVVGFLLYCKIKSVNKKLTLFIIENIPQKVLINPAKEKDFLDNISSSNLRTDNIIKISLDLVENFNPKIVFISDRNELNEFLSLKPDQKIPSTASLDKLIKWDDYYIYINEYYLKNNARPTLKTPKHYNELIKLFIKKNKITKKIVTITIRDCSYFPLRNSNVENWKKVYEYLEKNNYYPIILDDMENLSIQNKKNSLDGYNQYFYANIDLRTRLALYEEAFMNLSVSGGPSNLLIYSKYCKFLIFKFFVNDEQSPASLKNVEKIMGLKKNEQYTFFNKYQKLIWDIDDNPDLIINNFNKIIED
jgi:hypothetical protein